MGILRRGQGRVSYKAAFPTSDSTLDTLDPNHEWGIVPQFFRNICAGEKPGVSRVIYTMYVKCETFGT